MTTLALSDFVCGVSQSFKTVDDFFAVRLRHEDGRL